MANYLFILNDAPYGTERSYNGLRLARSLINSQETVRVFLMGDAAACAAAGQKVPAGYYNIGDMLGEERLIEGAARGSMDLLTEWTERPDKVLVC